MRQGEIKRNIYLKPQSRCAAGAVVSFFLFLSVERSVFRGTGEEERGCERQRGSRGGENRDKNQHLN